MKRMNLLKIWWLPIIILAVGLAVAGCDTNGKIGGIKKMEIGKPAPDFALQDAAGMVWKLSELKGKVVFLNFWATWCKPCRDEMPSMEVLNKAMAGKPFQMLAVAFNDDLAMADSFARRLGATFPVLGNASQELSQAYMITGVPETFLIDAQGILRHKFIGPYDWASQEMRDVVLSLF